MSLHPPTLAAGVARVYCLGGALAAQALESREATGGRQAFGDDPRGPEISAAVDEVAARQFLQWPRLCEVEALPRHATQLEKRGDLLLELDPLRHDVQSQGAAECDHGACQLRPVVVRCQPADEGAIDLEDVDRETMQVRQRRIPSAEIIERETDTERLQLLQALQVVLRVGHDGALGQLHDQVLRLETGDGQRVGDVPDEIAVLQMAPRDIHGDTQAIAASNT